MRVKSIYIRAVSMVLITALLCSACGTSEKDGERKSFSASGTAVMTPAGVDSETPAGIQAEDEEETKTEETKEDKDGTVWDTGREVTVKKDGFTYHAYLSKDGKESWIYQADPGSDRAATLVFPEEVQGAVATKLGGVPDDDCCYDIFGNLEEPWHDNEDNWDHILNRNTKGIRKVICPPAVRSITEAAFYGFGDLEEIVLPEQLRRIPVYLLFLCINLKKIVLPKKPDFAKTYDTFGSLTGCNSIKEVRLPEGNSDYCIKNGMLLSKDKKTLYQVFVTGETVKVPEGVTRIVTGAVNAIDITKIRSVQLPSTLKKMDRDAIEDESEEGELGGQIKNVTVNDKNPYLAQAGNCIYERATGTLAVFVGTKKSMTLPKEIRYISDAHIQLGRSIKKLVIPASLKAFETNQCFVEGIRVEEAIEFCSVTAPEVRVKGKGGEGLARILFIVPKEGVKTYKKWFEKVEGNGSKLLVKRNGNKACIARKDDIDISEMYRSEGARAMKKYGF